MKKIISLILAVMMVLCVAACGKTDAPEENKPAENIESPVIDEGVEDVTNEESKNEEESKEDKKPSSNTSDKKEETQKPSEKPEEKPSKEPKTVSEKLVYEFNSKAKSGSALSIAESIVSGGSLPFMAGAMEVSPGLLSGFDNYEVKGFKSGAVFQPMIGSIAFIGYVFELEDGVDAKSFVADLRNNANKRWNICVEADEMATSVVGNKVFFVMCPSQFEE